MTATLNLPQRIQRKRTKGWRMPEGAIYVGRGSKWGNPFKVGAPVPKVWLHMEFDRTDTIKYLGDIPVTDHSEAVRLYKKYAAPTADDCVTHLSGEDLACWCPLDKPCHADVLLCMANNP